VIALALTSSATIARADDAAIKKLLVGHWKIDNQNIELKDDGSMHAPNTTPAKWDVHNGALLERRSPESTLEFKILSVTKDKLVIQDLAHGRKTQTWIRGEH